MAELQSYPNGFQTWTVYSPALKSKLTSTVTAHNNQIVLIDPTELPPEVILPAKPSIIFITSGNHERGAFLLRKKLGVPVASSAAAVKDFSEKPDIILESGMTLHGMTTLPIHGAALGEVALFHQESRTIVLGDAIVHFPKTPCAILPDKYCSDPVELRKSLRQLLNLDFDTLMFAHGEPIITQAKTQLRTLLS